MTEQEIKTLVGDIIGNDDIPLDKKTQKLESVASRLAALEGIAAQYGEFDDNGEFSQRGTMGLSIEDYESQITKLNAQYENLEDAYKRRLSAQPQDQQQPEDDIPEAWETQTLESILNDREHN